MQNYESVQPEALKDSYTEYDDVDFVTTFLGKKAVGNTYRLEGDLVVYKKDTDRPVFDDDIKIDPMVGAHSFVNSVKTTTQNQGLIENFQNYPRYVKMKTESTQTKDDMINSYNVCEMKAPDQSITKSLIRGNTQNQLPEAQRTIFDNDFSIKLDFCLNNVVPLTQNDRPEFSYLETGAIRISINLSRIFDALYGFDVDNDCSYLLKNLRLSFMTVPDDGVIYKKVLKTKLSLEQSIQSSLANISTRVPALVRSVSTSYLKQSNMNSAVPNNNETEVLPLVDEVTYIFNDSTNRYISYNIKDREEMLYHYLNSFNNRGENVTSINSLKSNNAFGLGLNLGTLVDFTNQKFNIQLKSSVTNSAPYQMFLYFHSEVEM